MTTSPAPPDAPMPALRAAVFGVVGAVLGTVAHHLATDGPVLWRQSLTAVAVLFVVGLAGVRRPRSLPVVVTASGAAQAGLHLWLSVSPGHRMGAMATHAYGPGHVDAHRMWHERLHDSVAMTAAHVLATVAVAFLLHRADLACWYLARGVASALGVVRGHIAMACALVRGHFSRSWFVPRGRVPRQPDWWPPQAEALADVVVRRGPPSRGFGLVT